MKRKVRILLADDEKHIRSLMAVVCSTLGGVEVIGEAEDGEQAIAMFNQLSPDVVLLDINMPKLNGREVLKAIKSQESNTMVIMLTSLNSIEIVKECITSGARTYILKDNPPEKMREILKKMLFEKLQQITAD